MSMQDVFDVHGAPAPLDTCYRGVQQTVSIHPRFRGMAPRAPGGYPEHNPSTEGAA